MKAALAVLFVSAAVFCDAQISWGPSIDGIRLGIALAPHIEEPELHVFVQNVGKERREIVIGNENAKGIAYNLQFVATGSDGKAYHAADENCFVPLAALTLPVILRLQPGATADYHFPLKKLYFTDAQVSFPEFVRRGCSVHVRLEQTAQDGKSNHLTEPFIGEVASGEAIAAP